MSERGKAHNTDVNRLNAGVRTPDDVPVAFGVVIASVGRWEPLHALLGDIAAQTLPPRMVVVAHHHSIDDAPGLQGILAEFGKALTIRAVQCERGASNGRNAGAAALDPDVDWVIFPNDTSRLDPDFLARLALHCVGETTVCAVRLVDIEGDRNELPPAGTSLDRRTVWGAIEPATALRCAEFIRAGGFDPSIGTGATTPWQSGEITDLLLRMSAMGLAKVAWIDDLAVHAMPEFSHLSAPERRRKLRNYGRGSGYLLRRWDYPRRDRFRHVVGGALMPLRNRDKFGLMDGAMLCLGRVEGVLGRTIGGGGDHRAVLR